MTARIRSIALIVLCSYAVLILCPAVAAADTSFSLAYPPEPSRTAVHPAPPLSLSFTSTPQPASGGGSPFSMRTAHKVFGYGAIALGAVAALSSSSGDLHCASAWGAAGFGAAALATGIFKYRRVFDLGDGISKYDGHAILGGLAAAGFVIAVAMAGEGGDDEHAGGEGDDDANLAHASVGGAALGVMAVSVVLVKLKW